MGKNIAFITIPGPWSGVEVHTVALANALIESGHVVTIIEINSKPYSSSNQIPHARYQYLTTRPNTTSHDNIPNVNSYFEWKKHFNRLNVNTFVLVKGTFKFGSLAMEFAARSSCEVLIAIEHMHQPLNLQDREFSLVHSLFRGWWKKRLRLIGYLRSIAPKKIICVSEASAHTLVNDFFYPRRKICVCHSGVDINIFKPDELIRTQIRSQYKISDKSIVFGSVGRLSPMKNHRLMIDAFANVVETRPGADIHLIIVGDGPLKNELIMQRENCHCADKIHFAGFSDTPASFYAAFDYFCLSSTTGESFPLVLLEAMATNNRPIATDVGGVKESYSKEIGWLVTPKSIDELSSAMGEAVDSVKRNTFNNHPSPREYVAQFFNKTEKLNNLIETITN